MPTVSRRRLLTSRDVMTTLVQHEFHGGALARLTREPLNFGRYLGCFSPLRCCIAGQQPGLGIYGEYVVDAAE